ncbi:MAG: hypothetical protein AB1465_02760 [Patescibacteria group bacterium]
MRGDLTLKILEILDSMISTTADLLDIFTSGYYGSYRKAKRLSFNYPYRDLKTNFLNNSGAKNQKFYAFCYNLQKRGLIKKTKGKYWKITKEGKEKFRVLKRRKKLTIPVKKYKIKKGADVIIIIFDIPEREKKKRDWLRRVLYSLDFSMLQRSVLIGKTVLPQEFIKDLKDLEISQYIKIIVIKEGGKIQEL